MFECGCGMWGVGVWVSRCELCGFEGLCVHVCVCGSWCACGFAGVSVCLCVCMWVYWWISRCSGKALHRKCRGGGVSRISLLVQAPFVAGLGVRLPKKSQSKKVSVIALGSTGRGNTPRTSNFLLLSEAPPLSVPQTAPILATAGHQVLCRCFWS